MCRTHSRLCAPTVAPLLNNSRRYCSSRHPVSVAFAMEWRMCVAHSVTNETPTATCEVQMGQGQLGALRNTSRQSMRGYPECSMTHIIVCQHRALSHYWVPYSVRALTAKFSSRLTDMERLQGGLLYFIQIHYALHVNLRFTTDTYAHFVLGLSG